MLQRLAASLGLSLMFLQPMFAQTTYLEVADAVGLVPDHQDSLTCTGRIIPLESGSAWGDYDNDGDSDLFLTNGDGPSRFYRNDGDTNLDGLPDFTEIGVSLGLDDPDHVGQSAVFIDYDNDGDQDLFVTKWGTNSMYQNQLIESGSATFLDVTMVAGLDDDGRTVTSAWGDFDQDGLLDLFLAKHFRCDNDPRNDNQLFRNNGDGSFTDVTAYLCPNGVGNCPQILGASFSAGWVDYDNDGDPDLYVANEYPQTVSYPNTLYRNDGSDGSGGWLFTDVSAESGTNAELKSMGLGIGDFDNNGFFDFAVSNVGPNLLLKANGDGTYDDISESAGIERTFVIPDILLSVTWGTAFFDYNNDRLLDLLYVAGAIGQSGMFFPNAFFENNGDYTFTDVSDTSGLVGPNRARAVSTADLDRDGFVDVFIGNIGHPPHLYHNNAPNQGNSNHWLTVTVEGTTSNRDGIGTKLTLVTTDGVTQIREITSGASYGGGDERAARFGLGSYTEAELTVRWPTGEVDSIGTVAADQFLHLVEGGSGTSATCGDITQYGARCNSSGAVQSIVKILDGDFGGQVFTWLVDGEPVEVTVISDGSRSVARMAVPHAGIGAHTIELVDPAGCYGEDVVVCQIDAAPDPEMDALWNEYEEIAQAVEGANARAMKTRILGNYPNPFNPSTTIRYALASDSPVSVKVYNMLGQEVATLVDGFQKAGEQSAVWHGVNNSGQTVASGLYVYRIQAGNTMLTQKMLFTK
ncbi:MAG: FG-GAP-like repeat-containing protein [Ignavibacteria bacterium]|nr:FG-GAP-like repeat-containing protein [Ignavibacteria bacterium]